MAFNTLPDEVGFQAYANIPLTITESNHEYRLTFAPLPGTIVLTNQRLVWLSEAAPLTATQ